MPLSDTLKNFASSCERNQIPILAELTRYITRERRVLEVGSYSGQHALYFTEQLPNVLWQTSDTARYLHDLQSNISLYKRQQLPKPLLIDIEHKATWPAMPFDALFTANTLHIMSWRAVTQFFEMANQVLVLNGYLFIYGPFNYDGRYTSQSNAEFDIWLKERNSESAIRDIEAIAAQAELNGFILLEDIAMPANNRLLVYKKH